MTRVHNPRQSSPIPSSLARACRCTTHPVRVCVCARARPRLLNLICAAVRPPHIGDQGDADGSNAHHGHTAQPISIPGRKNSTESSEGMMAYIGSPPSTTAAWDTSLPSQCTS